MLLDNLLKRNFKPEEIALITKNLVINLSPMKRLNFVMGVNARKMLAPERDHQCVAQTCFKHVYFRRANDKFTGNSYSYT